MNGRVLDFLSSIPAASLVNNEYHRFHTDVILRAYPEFAGVPFAGKDAEARPAKFFNWNGSRQLASYVFRRPAGTLLRGSFLAPRVARALIDPSYVASVSWLLPMSIYLTQLEYCMTARFERI
ncbi:MAG: hypothetical protein ACRD4Y_14395 [Candidatus Acidiferrales bacterium]